MNPPTHIPWGKLALLACLLAFTADAQEADPGDGDGAKPAAVNAPDPEAAIRQLQLPPGFKAGVFAAEPRVANIAAFHIDHRGRFYVVEVFRRRGATLDMRGLPDWLEEDLASRTVADRIALVKKRGTPQQLAKMNADRDRVRLVEDRDGDGRADFDSVFATGLSRIEDGTAAGVLARPNGDVYFASIPDLWLLKDADGDGKAEQRKSLGYGYGVRFNISGHDLHGLRMGPDGRLYFSMGDRGLHVTGTPDGRVVSNPDSGAVLRCNPDGTGLEVFHTGLRNPQELAFDEYGNLFTGENNSDGGDASRWVYVVEGGDSGWRTSYQWHDFPVSRGPWNNERLWDAASPVPAAYIVPPIANPKISGPAGLTYAPGTGMPPEYNQTFFLVDFRGGPAGGSGVYTLKNQPKGAGFELAEVKPFLTNLLPTDVEFGYTGGFYVSDWITGWEPHGKGRIYRVFDPKAAQTPVVAETRKLIAEGIGRKGESHEELARLLSHPDMRVRQAAQFALADAGALRTLIGVLRNGTNRLARIHAVWALGQIGRMASDEKELEGAFGAPIDLVAEERDDEVRAQIAKILEDAGSVRGSFDALTALVRDPAPRVRYFATLSLGSMKDWNGAPRILNMVREGGGADPYLRHAAVIAIARINDVPAALRDDPSPAVRMVRLLALRRLGNVGVAEFLNDADPNIALEAARAINDLPIEPAMPALASLIEKQGLSDLVMMRALNAHFRLGTPESAAAVAKYARRSDAPDYLRIEAVNMLAGWANPPGRDRITGLWRPLPPRDGKPANDALAALVPGLLKDAPNAVRLAALLAGGKGGGEQETSLLLDIINDPKQPGGLRAAALGAFAERRDRRLGETVRAALADKDEALRVAAIRLQPRAGRDLNTLQKFLDTGSPREQQAVFQALATVKGREADAMLARALDRLLAGDLPPETHLDLLTAAEGRRGDVAAKLTAYEAKRPKAEDDPVAAHRESLASGDAERGRKIFLERADVSCLRCHGISGQGGNAGPDLAAVATRGDRAYLLESILAPSKKITPGWETVTVRTAKGDVIAGVLKAEDDQSITLDIPDKGPLTLKKADIRARRGGMSAMPEDIAKSLSRHDLRDLVEFLAGLKQPVPQAVP